MTETYFPCTTRDQVCIVINTYGRYHMVDICICGLRSSKDILVEPLHDLDRVVLCLDLWSMDTQ